MATRDSKGRYIKGHTHSKEVLDKISTTKTVYQPVTSTCVVCSKEYSYKPYTANKGLFCSKKCWAKRGKKIGRVTTSNNGYLRVWNADHPLAYKDGMCLVHRMVYYDHYGSIPKGLHIHHKNHDKTDNRIENLEAISNSDHQHRHRPVGSKVKNQYGTWTVWRTAK